MVESGAQAPAPQAPPPSSGGPPAGKKARPSKSQRQAAKAAAPAAPGLPVQPHPTTGSSKVTAAKSFASAASTAPVETSAPVFRPGSFPVVFNAAAQEASVDVWFTPDIKTVGEHADFVFEAVQASDGFIEFCSNASCVDDDAIQGLHSQFEGAAVLCAAQSICQAHVSAGFPAGDFGSLVTSDLVHLRSIRTIMSQYGDVRFDRVGQRYSVHHYTETVKAFIRQADKAKKATSSESRRAHRTCWWLPVQRADARTRFILACRLAKLVQTKDVGFVPSAVWLEDRILPSIDGAAPSWASSVFNAEEIETLAPLWKAFPTTGGAFVALFSGDQGSRLLELLGLEWADPESADLYWGRNFKEIVASLSEQWAGRAPVLKRFFEVADRSLDSGSSGSTAQFGSTDKFRGVKIASFSLDNGTAISSLAAAFFPSSVYDPSKEVDVKYTTTSPVGERAVAWVQRDLR